MSPDLLNQCIWKTQAKTPELHIHAMLLGWLRWGLNQGLRKKRWKMLHGIWIGLSNITAVGFWDKSANVRICQLVEPSNWKGKRKSGSAAKINTSSKSLTIFGWFSNCSAAHSHCKTDQSGLNKTSRNFFGCLFTAHLPRQWKVVCNHQIECQWLPWMLACRCCAALSWSVWWSATLK